MLQVGSYRFYIRPGLLATMLLLVGLGIMLGLWQMSRAEQKREIIALQEANRDKPAVQLTASDTERQAMLYRRVQIDGRLDLEQQVLLENRKHNGVAGYHVYTPMRLQGTDTWVMVNRGWIAQGADRSMVPSLPGPEGNIHIQGRVGKVPSVGIRLGQPAAELRWPMRVIYLDLEWLQQQIQKTLLPYVVYQTGENTFGLVRDWDNEWYGKQTITPEKHMGYAVQWFSLVALVVIMFMIFSFKRDR